MDNWDPNRPYDLTTPAAATAADDLQGRHSAWSPPTSRAQGRHATRPTASSAARPDAAPQRVDDARHDRGLLRHVRGAVPLRRRLERGRRHPAAAGHRAVAPGEREALRRRQQRRPHAALERSRVPRRRACSNDWFPRPRFYDLNGGSLQLPGGCLHPLRLGVGAGAPAADGNTDCWRPEKIDTFKDFSARTASGCRCGSSCRMRARRERMQAFIDSLLGRAAQGRALRAPAQQPPHPRSAQWLPTRRWSTATTACWSASRSPSSPCA